MLLKAFYFSLNYAINPWSSMYVLGERGEEEKEKKKHTITECP